MFNLRKDWGVATFTTSAVPAAVHLCFPATQFFYSLKLSSQTETAFFKILNKFISEAKYFMTLGHFIMHVLLFSARA